MSIDHPLSDEDVAKLIRASLHGREAIAEDEAERIYEWATNAAIDAALLQGVLAGHFAIEWDPDKPEPTFRSIRPYRAPRPPVA